MCELKRLMDDVHRLYVELEQGSEFSPERRMETMQVLARMEKVLGTQLRQRGRRSRETQGIKRGPKTGKDKRGHGRRGAGEYPGATTVEVNHPHLHVGELCPDCGKGHLFKVKKRARHVSIRVVGPIEATAYEQEILRCSSCLSCYTAPLPPHVPREKYDASFDALVVVAKYSLGVPYSRLAMLFAMMKIPVASSTQHERVAALAECARPVFDFMVRWAATAKVWYADDTGARVLELMRENKTLGPKERKGMHTTGIVADDGTHRATLYFTGRKHAGENLELLFKNRPKTMDAALLMSDASASNTAGKTNMSPEEGGAVSLNCLTHARRNFHDLRETDAAFCEEVLVHLGRVYHHDAETKRQRMHDQARLAYHQQKSEPIMNALKAKLTMASSNGAVEPNSELGKAIRYVLKRWNRLTGFLRIPGAPLDNNVSERALKLVVQHRKNSLFYKTLRGAEIGDILMSLIGTCRLHGVDALSYLTALGRHGPEVAREPERWLPWNFHERDDVGCAA